KFATAIGASWSCIVQTIAPKSVSMVARSGPVPGGSSASAWSSVNIPISGSLVALRTSLGGATSSQLSTPPPWPPPPPAPVLVVEVAAADDVVAVVEVVPLVASDDPQAATKQAPMICARARPYSRRDPARLATRCRCIDLEETRL